MSDFNKGKNDVNEEVTLDKIEKKEEQICNTESTNEKDDYDNQETVIGRIFHKVVTDEEYKNLLIVNPDEALADFELTDTQAILIKSLSEEDLNKLTLDNLDEFFAADAAVYTPDDADLMEFEAYDPEDFEDIDNE